MSKTRAFRAKGVGLKGSCQTPYVFLKVGRKGGRIHKVEFHTSGYAMQGVRGSLVKVLRLLMHALWPSWGRASFT